MRNLILFGAIISIFLVVQVSYSQSKSQNIDSIVNYFHSKDLFNGTILITNNGEMVYEKSLGFANIENKEKNSSNTIYPLCSVTKQFTAVGILILEQENKLTLDDRISKYLKVTPDCAKEITIRQLLTHTSGLPDYVWYDIHNNNDSIMCFFSKLDTLQFTPGEKHSYCNLGYALCGIIIEKITGKAYAKYMKEKIFIPLEMKNTFVFERKIRINNNIAIGYNPTWEKDNYFMITADGGILSTANDLIKWDKALYSEKLLLKENIEKIYLCMTLNNGEKIDYGLGVEIKDMIDGKTVLHAGSLSAYGAYLERNIDNQNSIILLSNRLLPELLDLLDYLQKIQRDEEFKFPVEQ